MKKLKTAIGIGILCAGLFLNHVFHIPYKAIPEIASGTVEALVDPNVPKFPLPPYRCAGYALLAAEIIGKGGFYFGNAWDLPKNNEILWQGEASRIEDVGVIPIGAILGIYNPSSRFNEPKRLFTHAALYIGEGKIAHQYGIFIAENDLNSYLKATGSKIRFVLVPPEEEADNHIYAKQILPGFYVVDY